MKLYHIDRVRTLNCGILNLDKNKALGMDVVISEMFTNNLNSYYKNDLSSHGMHYHENEVSNSSFIIDIIFEYERMLNFPNKLSRYESFFAFDKDDVIKFLSENKLEDYKIYEVESKYYEKHNMRLLKGNAQFIISELAKDYWNNDNRYNIDVDNPLDEYLLQFPINVIKEVKLEELK